MRTIFGRIPVVSNRPGLAVIPGNEIEELVDYEATAWEHWIFDAGASSLAGRVNNRMLVPVSVAPTYAAAHLTIANAANNGLYTGYADTAAAVDTLFGVFRLPANNLLVPLFGGYSTSTRGRMLFASAGTTAARNTLAQASGTTISNRDTSQPLTTEAWVFAALVCDFSATTKAIRALIGGQAGYAGTGTGSYTPRVSPTNPNNQLVVGRDDYASGAGGTLDCAEFGIFNRALTLAQLGDLYMRCKARQAARGNTVL